MCCKIVKTKFSKFPFVLSTLYFPGGYEEMVLKEKKSSLLSSLLSLILKANPNLDPNPSYPEKTLDILLDLGKLFYFDCMNTSHRYASYPLLLKIVLPHTQNLWENVEFIMLDVWGCKQIYPWFQMYKECIKTVTIAAKWSIDTSVCQFL